MAKIYNEIVIDMNPESSSYGETLHEDSFEYSGDMMLAQEEYARDVMETGYEVWIKRPTTNPDGSPYGGGAAGMYGKYTWNAETNLWHGDASNYLESPPEGANSFESQDEFNTWRNTVNPATLGGRQTMEGYGMEGLTSETFLGMNEDEAYKYILDTKYGGKLPDNVNETEIRRLLGEYLPKRGLPEGEEVGFLAEQYGGATQVDDPSTPYIDESQQGQISFAESLAGRQAGLAKETAMSRLQGQAGQVGQAMGSVYGGGTATSMRAGIAGQKAIGEGFQQAQDVYALAGETAGLGYREGIYGLEEKAESKWERDFTTFLNSLPPAIG